MEPRLGKIQQFVEESHEKMIKYMKQSDQRIGKALKDLHRSHTNQIGMLHRSHTRADQSCSFAREFSVGHSDTLPYSEIPSTKPDTSSMTSEIFVETVGDSQLSVPSERSAIWEKTSPSSTKGLSQKGIFVEGSQGVGSHGLGQKGSRQSGSQGVSFSGSRQVVSWSSQKIGHADAEQTLSQQIE